MTEKITIDLSVVEQALEALDSARVWKTRNLHKLTIPQLAVAATDLRVALTKHQQTESLSQEFLDWWGMTPSLTLFQARLLWKQKLGISE